MRAAGDHQVKSKLPAEQPAKTEAREN